MITGRKHFRSRHRLALMILLAFCFGPLPGINHPAAQPLLFNQRANVGYEPDQSFPSAGRWLQVTGPVGNVRTLSVIGNRLLAVSEPGINISTDHGANWQPAYNTSLTKYADSFAILGTKLFAGTPFALTASTDNGASWTGINYDPRSPIPTRSLAVIENQLYAIRGTNLSVSSDQGISWTRLNDPPGQTPGALVTDGAKLFVTTSEGVFVSKDQGQNWSELGGAGQSPKANSLVISGTDIFAISSSGLSRWTGSDEKWAAVNNGLPAGLTPQALAVKTGRIFAAINSTLYVSNNNGSSWSAVNTGSPLGRIGALAANSTHLFMGLPAGVYVSTDDGTTWTPTSNGPPDGRIRALAATQSKFLAGTENNGIYISTDGGKKWAESNRGLTAMSVYALTLSGANILAGTDNGIFLSTDAGQSWTAMNTGLTARNVYALAVDGAKIAAGTENGVFITENGGANWRRASDGLPNVSVFTVAFKGASIFAGLNRVYVSTDNGTSWKLSSNGIPGQFGSDRISFILSLTVLNDKIYAGTASGGVYVSSDNGATWISFACGMEWMTPQMPHLASVPFLTSRDNRLFAGTNVGALTAPSGVCNWARYNDGLITDGATGTVNHTINSLLLSGESFLAATAGGGIFVSTVPAPRLSNSSAASYASAQFATESIVAGFGDEIAADTQIASTLPLPTMLAGTSIKVKDSLGAERLAPIFFVSPNQVNYQIPAETATGTANITLTNSKGSTLTSPMEIRNVAPGLFSANADGKGVAAAVALRVKADGAIIYEAIARYDPAQKKSVPVPLALGPETDQVFLILFGTGMRFRSSLSAVEARFGSPSFNTPAQVLFVGPQTDFAGLDQVNVRVPRSLIGSGGVAVTLLVDGQTANSVSINIQ